MGTDSGPVDEQVPTQSTSVSSKSRPRWYSAASSTGQKSRDEGVVTRSMRPTHGMPLRACRNTSSAGVAGQLAPVSAACAGIASQSAAPRHRVVGFILLSSQNQSRNRR